jgi:hypothetical protein
MDAKIGKKPIPLRKIPFFFAKMRPSYEGASIAERIFALPFA